jgi:hypothetical protein
MSQLPVAIFMVSANAPLADSNVRAATTATQRDSFAPTPRFPAAAIARPLPGIPLLPAKHRNMAPGETAHH